MNKKAQISEGILPLIAFALSAFALFAFLTFDNPEIQSEELSQLISEIEFNQQYVIKQAELISKETMNLNPDEETFKTVAKNHEEIYLSPIAGNFYAKIRNNDFKFTKQEDKFKLEIPDLFVRSERGANKITRNFDICMEFNSTGDFNKNC